MQKLFWIIPAFMAVSACSQWQETPPPPPPAPVASAPRISAEFLQGWMNKGQFDELRGDFSAAVQDYQSILQVDPANIPARLAQARAWRNLGEYDRAFGAYTEVLKASPNNLDAKEGGALTLIAKGDYTNSITLLDEVLRPDSRRPEALNGMGALFTTRGLQADAQQYFAEALKYAPSHPVVLGNIGLSQALEGKHAQAIATLKAASAVAIPGSYERKRADLNTALVHAASGHPEDALAIAGAYYAGSSYNSALGLYAKLASNKKMATQYLHSAITGGRTYYEQAWDSIPTTTGR